MRTRGFGYSAARETCSRPPAGRSRTSCSPWVSGSVTAVISARPRAPSLRRSSSLERWGTTTSPLARRSTSHSTACLLDPSIPLAEMLRVAEEAVANVRARRRRRRHRPSVAPRCDGPLDSVSRCRNGGCSRACTGTRRARRRLADAIAHPRLSRPCHDDRPTTCHRGHPTVRRRFSQRAGDDVVLIAVV